MNTTARYSLLKMMTKDAKKFGLALGYHMPLDEQVELEDMQNTDWIRLIDVSFITETPGQVMRVFKCMPVAVEWYEAEKLKGWRA